MKKISKFLLLIMFFYACQNVDISVRKANASNHDTPDYAIEDEYFNGMHYKIFTLNAISESSQTGYYIGIINITKDSLECEYFKKNLKK